MDEIKKAMEAYNLDATIQSVLLELIYEYGNDQYEDGMGHQKAIFERINARSM